MFKIIAKDGKARAGEIKTKHGVVKTPCFVPVATRADIKLLDADDISQIDPELLVANTYHLGLKPGPEILAKAGGINEFSQIKTPFMTDSGGFQVFSLGLGAELAESKFKYTVDGDKRKDSKKKFKSIAKIKEKGVHFRSVYDNSRQFLSPEKSIQIQKAIGADIILVLDECPPPSSDYDYTKKSMHLTHRWALRSLEEHGKDRNGQLLYGIVQGGLFEDLRIESAKFIDSLNFDGFAIGGSFGQDEMKKSLDQMMKYLSEDKPKHLLGIGTVPDFFEGVKRGVDSFDCVTPTRLAREGYAFIGPDSGGDMNNKYRFRITKQVFKEDFSPIDKNCQCRMCKTYSRAYVNHLFKVNDYLAHRIVTYHNVYFYVNLLKEIRKSIIDGNFNEMYKKWVDNY